MTEANSRADAAPADAATKTLLLIDGSSYLYRAFHSPAGSKWEATLPDGRTVRTGALRIMINMLGALKKKYPAAYCACVFDAPGPTFRDEIYPKYKATRSPMPDELRAQIEPIHEACQLLGWNVVHMPGVEADDVIGTLACMASAQGIEVVISSGDKDLSQLVDQHITVIDTMNDKRRDQFIATLRQWQIERGLFLAAINRCGRCRRH